MKLPPGEEWTWSGTEYVLDWRAGGREAAADRRLLEAQLVPTFVDVLCAATNGGWALGGRRLNARIARVLGRPAGKFRLQSHFREVDQQTSLL